MLAGAAGAVGAAAVAQSDAAALEVAEELVPFGVGGGAIFLAGTGGAAAGDEGAVAVDHFLGVDGLISHGGVDVAVPDDQLGDVRRHPVEDGVGDEQSSEIVGGEQQWGSTRGGQAGSGEGVVEQCPHAAGGDWPVLDADFALEQQGHRRVPDAFVDVVGHCQRDHAVGVADPADDRAEHLCQLRFDDQQPFGVGLRRGDVQQRDELAGVG